MYGLKEKALARYLIKIMKIEKSSEDGHALLNWKSTSAKGAGNFAKVAYEVISKRPFRVDVGDMTIGQVNDQLDKLSAEAKEEKQLPILADFYQRMNAEEMMWIISIILREMKVGATEKTFFDVWHPDAESLFNVSSNLRRVCWELYNPNVRLEGEDRGVALMQCYQPQLAQFQIKGGFEKMVLKMRPTEDDDEFWIEDKLDGERMQMHMQRNEGGLEFRWWSRKAKDYTYLYGDSLVDEKGSVTKHLTKAFDDGVDGIILDGEMITWDMEQDRICAFGTLKTAALSEQRNMYALTPRPLYRVFDILFLNGTPLTQYTLRDRRNALERAVKPVERRLELHSHEIGKTKEDIEKALRKIIDEASEGLVVKNPRSAYRLSDRNDDWMKVKPEYMLEYGEHLDCIVIGGYYGSGKKSGRLSSYLCGLFVHDSREGKDAQKCVSFFKVGGGINANDYARFDHITENKWIKWDPKKPPTNWITLGGGDKQKERPDVWIKPVDSFVIEAKAASVGSSDEFAAGLTLRFPRYRRFREDRDWKNALSVQSFLDMKAKIEEEKTLKEEGRKKTRPVSKIKPLKVVGYGRGVDRINIDNNAGMGEIFHGLTFFVMTDSTTPQKKSKNELEAMIKAHSGRIVQTHDIAGTAVYCVADRNTVKVASLRKKRDTLIIKPMWIFDCIQQSKVDSAMGLPERVVLWEPKRHFYFASEEENDMASTNVDKYGDPYYRDTTVEELRTLMAKMGDVPKLPKREIENFEEAWEGDCMPGWMFKGVTIFFDTAGDSVNGAAASQTEQEAEMSSARTTASFAGATIATSIEDDKATHVVVSSKSDVKAVRKTISSRRKLPRIVTTDWITESWFEKTLLDEERFVP